MITEKQHPAVATICALSSGRGRAGVAVIRISGPSSAEVLRDMCGGVPEPRRAGLRKLVDPRTGTLLDQGLVLWFPAPASFTGEDMAELHVHGGRAVVASIIDALLSYPSLRLAEPGEFAARAFENGKLDLTEVEGLADLVNAETEAQARQALAQAQGYLRELYEGWRERLLRAEALVEAGLDFADEADVARDVTSQAEPVVAELLDSISRHLADRSGERLREGFSIVIAGPPNAGKSSLLNALAKRDVAIVSEEAGTTRDAIEVHLDLRGLPVILTDTAGLREKAGSVEAEGVRRALARAAAADLVLWLIDAEQPVFAPPDSLQQARAPILHVVNKIDLVPSLTHASELAVSAKTGAGLDSLIDVLAKTADRALAGAEESAAITRARHRSELEAVASALSEYQQGASAPELKAEALRLAARHLGRLTGRIDVEEVLGAIFSEFCIGK